MIDMEKPQQIRRMTDVYVDQIPEVCIYNAIGDCIEILLHYQGPPIPI
jgi:hypothetical protein